MKKELVGIEDATYTKKDGTVAVGVRLHYTEELPEPGIGIKASNEYVPNRTVRDFSLGPFNAFLYEPYANGKFYRCTGII